MALERAKDFTLRAYFRAAQLALRGAAAPLPDWRARPHRVLFLRHDKIGDMLTSTGFIRAIAEAHPTVTVDVLASRGNAAVLAEEPYVGRVLVFDGVTEWEGPRAALRAAPALRAARYDAVIDGLVVTPAMSDITRTLLAACGAPRRIGMRACNGRPRGGAEVYTHPIEPPADPHAHHVEYLARLAGPFGVAPDQVPPPTLRLTPDEWDRAEQVWLAAARDRHAAGEAAGAPRLVVNLSAGHPQRRWSDAQFVAAIRHVRAAHPPTTILVIGDPAERAAVERVAAETGTVAPATASVRAALALIAQTDGVFTPDTAIAHAASLFGKACVTLMLAEGAESFFPYRTRGTIVRSPTMEMTAIPVDAVARALDDLVALCVRRVRPTRTTNPGGAMAVA